MAFAWGVSVALAQAPESPTGEIDPAWSRENAGRVALVAPHFDVAVAGDETLATLAGDVAAVAEAVLPVVERRLGLRLPDRVRLEIWPSSEARGTCPARAAAMPTQRRIVLFAGPATLAPAALRAFLAHELGHQLTYDRWGTLGADLRLTEGIATWAAEPYWLAWRGWDGLDSGVAALLDTAAPAPLAAPRQGCLVASERDLYYSVWASFVGFLLRHYGWERFGEALTLPSADEGRAAYPDVYRRSLEELSAAWEQELRGPTRAPPP